MNTTGLVRVTIAAPRRRIDLALPERSPLAELLPGLLRHAGEPLGDDCVWVLRRPDGAPLDVSRTAAGHRVRDGEVLHLTSARTEWPELEYDDVVDAIASGSARTGGAWAPPHTRLVGLCFAFVAMLCGLAGVLINGSASLASGTALVLLFAAVLLARAAGDAGAGAVVAMCALPFAFVGGVLLFAGQRHLVDLGPPHLLTGSAAVLLVALAALFGVVDRAAVFVAALTSGLLGVAGAGLSMAAGWTAAQSGAVLAGAVLVFSPLLGPLAIRLAGLPLPVLPKGPADLVRSTPHVERKVVYAAVIRADGLLTGMLAGGALVALLCQALIVRAGGTAGTVLVPVLAAGFLLRARLHPIVRQRVPLLVCGFGGLVCLAVPLLGFNPWLVVGGALTAGAVVAWLGLHHSVRRPSPYLGRYAELVEVVVVLAVVPLVCWVLGLYVYLRGLAG